MAEWKSSRVIKDDEKFKRDIQEYGVMKVAEMMGISSTTVKEHCRRLGIQSKYGTGTPYCIENTTAVFTTRSGENFYVDPSDAGLVSKYRWYIAGTGYVVCDHRRTERILLHRILMNAPSNMIVDHINRDTKDNRKENLRLVTPSQNLMNRGIESRNKSGVTGVCWAKANHKWLSYISINNKRMYLGYYDTIEDAAQVRREAEKKYFGEYSINKEIED